ncbi:hypothetical protein CAOG_01287 [Capsaspora owczarzaki ATCC 30864]|uniref:SET domain-containing protein n=1 Tax=Capsaspora owczarzaki (strain ATCC 30864) TaxID=595528 RepID=A0A0D2WK16_CAPO3|nr:hypothetical protein CAOG_01287 [Capsaspora owczarzaki ATCC 30864]KJE89873.1 hypothetical protein CAOG_001287 [Capsaspora owczarzaki ATCC 30864]|eukprot:XP_004349807.2 hypothetical protein CAOG_01287 [Capsaspora owczarzaki ATCC 30864]
MAFPPQPGRSVPALAAAILVLHWLLLPSVSFVQAQEGRLVGGTAQVQRIIDLVSWARRAEIEMARVDIRPSTDTSASAKFLFESRGLGLVLNAPARRGEAIVTLPPRARFRVPAFDSALRSLIDEFNEQHDNAIDPMTALALGLMYERSRADSPWRAWLRMLPDPIESMLEWNDVELWPVEQLYVKELREERIRNLEAVYESVITPFIDTYESDLVGVDFTIEAFVWAAVIAQTRGLHESEKNGLSLLPIVDMINHHREPNAVVVASGPNILVRTKTSLKAGEEITIDYEMSSHVLLLLYGFVEMSENLDFYPIRLSWESKDIDYPRRLRLLEGRGLSSPWYEFRLWPSIDEPIDDDLQFAMRVMVANEHELAILEQREKAASPDANSEISIAHERRMLRRLLQQIHEACPVQHAEMDALRTYGLQHHECYRCLSSFAYAVAAKSTIITVRDALTKRLDELEQPQASVAEDGNPHRDWMEPDTIAPADHAPFYDEDAAVQVQQVVYLPQHEL